MLVPPFQASNRSSSRAASPFWSPVFAGIGKTDPACSVHPLANLGAQHHVERPAQSDIANPLAEFILDATHPGGPGV
jgi:hypothetical protein